MKDMSMGTMRVAHEYPPMQRALTAAALVAGLGFGNPLETIFQAAAKIVASDVAHSLINGIILGSDVGPYQSQMLPAQIELRVTASGHRSTAPTDDIQSPASDQVARGPWVGPDP